MTSYMHREVLPRPHAYCTAQGTRDNVRLVHKRRLDSCTRWHQSTLQDIAEFLPDSFRMLFRTCCRYEVILQVSSQRHKNTEARKLPKPLLRKEEAKMSASLRAESCRQRQLTGVTGQHCYNNGTDSSALLGIPAFDNARFSTFHRTL